MSLKEHIANILNVERVLQYIETLPIHQEEVQKADAQLVKKQEEIDRYSRLKTTLYESLTDGLIDKTEYLELKSGYDRKIADAQAASEKLKEELESLLQNRTGSNLWIEQFKNYKNITELTRHIAVTLIDRIMVYEDCRMDIRFRYQYNYERALELIQNMQMSCQMQAASQGREAV